MTLFFEMINAVPHWLVWAANAYMLGLAWLLVLLERAPLVKDDYDA